MSGPGGKKVGRRAWAPTVVDIERAAAARKAGATLDQIAEGVLQPPIGPRTLYAYLEKYPDSQFSQSLKSARAGAIVFVAGKLYDAASKGNIAAQIFYLKAQAGWRDRVEMTGDPAAPLAVAVQSPRLGKQVQDQIGRIITDAIKANVPKK